MRNMMTLCRRELTACFYSPGSYIAMVLFVACVGCTFLLSSLKSQGLMESLPNLLFSSVLFWLTLLVTAVSMRLFTDENRSGTMETLLTAPVREREVVLGKFTGALVFVVVVMAPAVAGLYVVTSLSPALTMVDAGCVLGGSVMLVLLASMWMAVGMFISLLTRSYITAAIGCFCAVWVILLAGWLLKAAPGVPAAVIEYVSVTAHMEAFAAGTVSVSPIVYCLSLTALALFASVRVLESRRWK